MALSLDMAQRHLSSRIVFNGAACLHRRYRLGKLQQDVADAAEVDRSYISALEAGSRTCPSFAIVQAIADELEMDPEELLLSEEAVAEMFGAA